MSAQQFVQIKLIILTQQKHSKIAIGINYFRTTTIRVRTTFQHLIKDPDRRTRGKKHTRPKKPHQNDLVFNPFDSQKISSAETLEQFRFFSTALLL